MTVTNVSPETIGELFDNALNREEGWGVFLVRDPKGTLRLEVQRIDEMAIFDSDESARSWLWAKAQLGERHRLCLEQLRQAAPEAYQQVFGAGLWKHKKAS